MFDVDGVAEEARRAVGAFPDDPTALSDDESAKGFTQLQQISELVEAKRLRWLADQDRRASYRRDGYLSTAAWLADRFKVGVGSAKQQVRVAQALEEMPQARQALEDGGVSSAALTLLVSAREAHPRSFAQQGSELIEQARGKSIEELRRVIVDWSQGVDDDGSLRRAEVLRAKRRLDAAPRVTGMVGVDGDLDPEGGEVVLTALQAAVDADLRAGGPFDLRTPAQRRADALVDLARRYLDSTDRPTVAGERPHVTLTVGIETLRAATNGHTLAGELDHTGTIPIETARRLACDASVLPVVMGSVSEPLDIGRRTPVVSSGQRRAVALRDRRCRFPRCERPHPWCDAHHIKHWADGGRTALDNLVLLCRPHHLLLHEGGFGLRRVDGEPVFTRPDGSALEDDRAPPSRAG